VDEEGKLVNVPAAERTAQRTEIRSRFSSVAGEFMPKPVNKTHSARETARVIRTYLLPSLGRAQIAEIKRREIGLLLDHCRVKPNSARLYFVVIAHPHCNSLRSRSSF